MKSKPWSTSTISLTQVIRDPNERPGMNCMGSADGAADLLRQAAPSQSMQMRTGLGTLFSAAQRG